MLGRNSFPCWAAVWTAQSYIIAAKVVEIFVCEMLSLKCVILLIFSELG